MVSALDKKPNGMRVVELEHNDTPFSSVYLDLRSQGKSDLAIAQVLGITPKTLRLYKERAGMQTVIRLQNGVIVE